MGAHEFAGKNTSSRIAAAPFLALFHLHLHIIEHLRRNDGFMPVRHIIARELPFVLAGFLRQEIQKESFLQERIALVL